MLKSKVAIFSRCLEHIEGGVPLFHSILDYCKKNGIKIQLTASYPPQQNGISERKNRTIVEMARSRLKVKGLPKVLWAEAIFLCYISPKQMPYEECG